MRELRLKYGDDYEQQAAVPVLTDACNLPARKVIHIVGPIVYDRVSEELERQLVKCYTETLNLCAENHLKSVAFCCISTGVFRFPNQRAAETAVKTVEEWLQSNPETMERIIFNVFKDIDKEYYEELLS